MFNFCQHKVCFKQAFCLRISLVSRSHKDVWPEVLLCPLRPFPPVQRAAVYFPPAEGTAAPHRFPSSSTRHTESNPPPFAPPTGAASYRLHGGSAWAKELARTGDPCWCEDGKKPNIKRRIRWSEYITQKYYNTTQCIVLKNINVLSCLTCVHWMLSNTNVSAWSQTSTFANINETVNEP